MVKLADAACTNGCWVRYSVCVVAKAFCVRYTPGMLAKPVKFASVPVCVMVAFAAAKLKAAPVTAVAKTASKTMLVVLMNVLMYAHCEPTMNSLFTSPAAKVVPTPVTMAVFAKTLTVPVPAVDAIAKVIYVYAVFVKLPEPSYVKVLVVKMPDGIDPLKTMLVKIPNV